MRSVIMVVLMVWSVVGLADRETAATTALDIMKRVQKPALERPPGKSFHSVQSVPADPSLPERPIGPSDSYPSIPSGDFLIPPPLPAAFSSETELDYEPAELLVLSLDLKSAQALRKRLRGQGFHLLRRRYLKTMGLLLSVFRKPQGISAPLARDHLRRLAPKVSVSLNHRYRPQSGGMVTTGIETDLDWQDFSCALPVSLGLLDGPVLRLHPAIQGRHIETAFFIRSVEKPGGAGHATAIASILMGQRKLGGFALLPAAKLINAAVYRKRGQVVDATAEGILIGLDYLASKGVKVLMLSLGGADNPVLHLGIRRLRQRGLLLVAAAGNGGPQGEPVYPAAWPEVVAVTAVDRMGHVFEKATHGEYVELAAPGIQLKVAWAGDETRRVSGTSYAVPFVAAAGAILMHQGNESSVVRGMLHRLTRDFGVPGRDPVFGFGVLVPPACKKSSSA